METITPLFNLYYHLLKRVFMSKHNNNLKPPSHARCRCGRYATIGEWKSGIGLTGAYTCPDCAYHENKKRFEARHQPKPTK